MAKEDPYYSVKYHKGLERKLVILFTMALQRQLPCVTKIDQDSKNREFKSDYDYSVFSLNANFVVEAKVNGGRLSVNQSLVKALFKAKNLPYVVQRFGVNRKTKRLDYIHYVEQDHVRTVKRSDEGDLQAFMQFSANQLIEFVLSREWAFKK